MIRIATFKLTVMVQIAATVSNHYKAGIESLHASQLYFALRATTFLVYHCMMMTAQVIVDYV